jgi:hypothetical protein
VSQQELNLVQFSAGKVAEPGAGPSQIVRGQFWNIGTSGGRRLSQLLDILNATVPDFVAVVLAATSKQ